LGAMLGYKLQITELRYFYILVRSKGYELDGVRRTIDSKLNRYPYPSFILIIVLVVLH
jgi:hypothetical protein